MQNKIIILFIFQIVNEAIYGFNYFENIFDEVKIFHNEGNEYFSKHILIHLFFSYIGLFIFSFPFFICEVKKGKNSILLPEYETKINKNQYFWIILISFLWVVEEILFIFYSLILGGLEIWFLEVLIVCYLGSKMIGSKLYKHKKLAIIINLFPLILKFISIALSAKLEKTTTNLIYIRHIWVIPLSILIYLILSIIRSFANLKIIKTPYSYYPFSYKILMIYGLIGAIFISIICIFTSRFNCNLGEIQNYFCKVSDNNNNKYIDSFKIYHNIFQGYSNGDSSQIKFEILTIIFGGITFIICKYFFIKMILYFTPIIFVFSFPILFLLRKIILIIIKFSFDMIGDILSLISFLICSELVVLNFGGFNSRIKFYNPPKPSPPEVFPQEDDLLEDKDEDSLLY